MNKEVLEKYFKNSCTAEELSSVLEWFEGSARTAEGKALLFQIWEQLSDEDSDYLVNFDLILDRIHQKANLDQSKELLEKADHNLIRNKRRKHYISFLTRVAAVLFVPVFCFALYTSFKYQSVRHGQIFVNQAFNEVFSSVDAITKVTLPDGSKVWLNHSSRLKYPALFQGDSRTVELTGEGYFEVTPNPKIPFVVRAGEIRVVAHGTTFNILAYSDEDRIETSLINGVVEIQKSDAGSNTVYKLRPSELAIYQKSDKQIITHPIEDERYYSWKDGKLIFKKEPMSEVVKKLSRWFNVEIQIKDPELLELTYTATFVHETLPQIMELMTLVTPVNYTISNRKEIDEGVFTKREIILSYRKK